MSREPHPIRPHRRPFWLPASTFYFLTAAITIAVFFVTWAILAEAKEQNPWIAAGLMASVSMVAGVVLREVILRQRRNSLYLAQRRIDTSVLSMPVAVRREPATNKLTLEQNAFLLSEIKKKSEAAKILGNLPESHREIFTLCAQYIEVVSRELPNVGVGSPRLAAIKNGRDHAQRLHEYHMLKWAELEIKANVGDSHVLEPEEMLDGARRALNAAETALTHYPGNAVLAESHTAIELFIASGKVKTLLKRAQTSESRGGFETAIRDLRNARDLIMSNRILADDEDRIEEISVEIERLSDLMRR